MKHVFLLCLVVFFVACVSAQSATNDVVSPVGTIRGHLSTDSHAYIYRGIPYVDAYKRFEHSKVFSGKFSTLFDAAEDSPASPQNCHLPPHTCPESFDELNSLSLNIFTPIKPSNEPLPVLWFAHGGNFFQGSGGGPLYNATTIVNTGSVIVVTSNYRLGILGFYRDEAAGIYGNYGFVDQINSLKWVRNNIASFGGDPNNVTVFGQSAGGGSTAVHLISQYSQGLFHKAIIQSNPFAIPYRSIKTKEGLVKAFRKHSDCTTRECILNLPVDKVIEAQVATSRDLDAAGGNLLSVFIPFNPYVETPGQEEQDPEYPGIVPYQPHEAFLRGLVKNIPIIVGAVRDESDIFIYQAFEDDVSDLVYTIFAGLLFGEERNKRIQERYPPTPKADNRDNLCTVGTEFIFHCSGRNATRGMITTSVTEPVYSYVFDAIYSFNDKMWGPDFSICTDRVCHAAELPSVFNSAQWMFAYDAAEQKLADSVNQYWTNFAHTGNPNFGPSQTAAVWDEYKFNSGSMRLAKEGNKMIYDYLGPQCTFWDSIGYFL